MLCRSVIFFEIQTGKINFAMKKSGINLNIYHNTVMLCQVFSSIESRFSMNVSALLLLSVGEMEMVGGRYSLQVRNSCK